MIGLPKKACVVVISYGQWWLMVLVRDIILFPFWCWLQYHVDSSYFLMIGEKLKRVGQLASLIEERTF
jgi:hypothetical protein